jgi:hypothetical protein
VPLLSFCFIFTARQRTSLLAGWLSLLQHLHTGVALVQAAAVLPQPCLTRLYVLPVVCLLTSGVYARDVCAAVGGLVCAVCAGVEQCVSAACALACLCMYVCCC